MTPSIASGLLIGFLGLPAMAADLPLSQPLSQQFDTQQFMTQQIAQADLGKGLTESDQPLFETRDRQGLLIPIPPSSEEAGTPLAPDVPTPPLNWTFRSGGTLPGGALSGTGSGTGPASNPGGAGLGGPWSDRR